MNILIVDDEKDIIDLTAMWIEDLDFDVEFAMSVGEGKAKISNKKFDLVLTDYSFPDGTGDEIIRHLRHSDNAANTCTLLMSGKIDESTAISYSNITFVPKPFTKEYLQSKVKEVIENRDRPKEETKVDRHFFEKIVETTSVVMKNFISGPLEHDDLHDIESTLEIKGSLTTVMNIDTNFNIGKVCITFDGPCILSIVSNMIFEEVKEINTDVIDAACEITNMIVGNAKRRLPQYKFVMAKPVCILGSDYRINFMDGAKCERTTFKTPNGSFVVDYRLLKSWDEPRDVLR